MAEFMLHRDYRVISKSGHSIQFKKGEPTYVPPECRSEVIAIGAQPVDGNTDVLGEEKVVVELTVEERREQLIKAFKTMQERTHRGDFTGQGFPAAKALEKLVDFEPEKREVEELWQAFREEQAS